MPCHTERSEVSPLDFGSLAKEEEREINPKGYGSALLG